MSDDLRSTLLAYFANEPVASADMIAKDLGIGHREVQDKLIEMDDEGFLMMRNGFYKLSARAKKDVG